MSLTPKQALARVPLWKSMQDLQPKPLPGGITNRNYRVEVNGESFVLRMSGKNTELLGIHRPTEREANRAAAALGLAPEVVYFIEPEVLVTRFIEGNPISIETMGEENWLAQVAHALHRFHSQGPSLDTTFDIFEVIASLTNVAHTHTCTFPENFDWLMEKVHEVESAFAHVVLNAVPNAVPNAEPVVPNAEPVVPNAEPVVPNAEPYTPRPCHNDLLNGNFLNANGKLIILDWEYAGMGDVYFDLANFSHHHSLTDDQIRFFLEQYFGTTTEKHFARLKLMEPLSDMREALWGTVQTGISTLDEDFAGYAHAWYTRASEAFQDARVGMWLQHICE